MDSDEITYITINEIFKCKLLVDEYVAHYKSYYDTKRGIFGLWKDFILMKDLGIICLDCAMYEYKITDHKKWAIAKIKYGF